MGQALIPGTIEIIIPELNYRIRKINKTQSYMIFLAMISKPSFDPEVNKFQIKITTN